MYVKKMPGPRLVTLPDGSILSMADLPDTDVRWVASRKAVVVRAVEHGLLSRAEAIDRYDLSEEEFDGWARAVAAHGVTALRVTAIQKYRTTIS